MNQSTTSRRRKPLFKADSYEASLTPEQLEKFHDLLCSGKSVKQIIAASIPWCKGQRKGKKISRDTVYDVRSRLDLEDMLLELKGTTEFMEGMKTRLSALVEGADAERVLDEIMALIGQEVIYKTLKRLKPSERDAAARLLLKRADQRRVDQRLHLVASTLQKDGPTGKSDIGLTDEEKHERMKEILRIN